MQAGSADERRTTIDREALIHNENPFALSFYPSGEGKAIEQGVVLSGEGLQATALKREDNGEDFVLRLYNPTDETLTQNCIIDCMGIKVGSTGKAI